MSSTSTKTNFQGRKATFTSEVIKGKRVFTAVNRRAHIVCNKNGKKSKLGVSELKASSAKGSYRFFEYTKTGALKAIKF